MEAFLMEKATVKQVAGPVDLNTAAITGNRVSMKGFERVAFIVSLGDSTSATALEFTTRQHDAASSGNSKDLDHANPYYHKVGAATSFTKVTPTVADALITMTSALADEPGTVVIEVLAEDLDRANNYAWVSLDLADAGAAKIVSVVAVCMGPAQKPAYGTVV